MVSEAGTWIFEQNLRAFAEVLADLAGYAFDDHDWIAVSYGVRDTDGEAGRWFTYPFEGTEPLHLDAAIEPGTSVVLVRVRSDVGLTNERLAQLDLLINICQTYRLI